MAELEETFDEARWAGSWTYRRSHDERGYFRPWIAMRRAQRLAAVSEREFLNDLKESKASRRVDNALGSS